ncbi:hypothetical protein PR001_g10805 [Phytophthora rubi]|nr:hypothetical protein PR001_g10805 [Phytophthora rubi]
MRGVRSGSRRYGRLVARKYEGADYLRALSPTLHRRKEAGPRSRCARHGGGQSGGLPGAWSGWLAARQFPDQAESLMAKPDLRPAVVILLDPPEEDCVARINGRRFDPVTGSIFHSPATGNLPRDAVVRARLTRRRDDTSDRLSPRFEAYRTFGEATNELFARSQGVVHRVDASKSPIVILEDVSALLHSLVAKPRLIYLHNNNNQTQQVENTAVKVNFRQRPEAIVETSEENEDDDMQQYQYDWENEKTSIDPRRRESPQKQQQPKEKTAHSAKKEGQKKNFPHLSWLLYPFQFSRQDPKAQTTTTLFLHLQHQCYAP